MNTGSRKVHKGRERAHVSSFVRLIGAVLVVIAILLLAWPIYIGLASRTPDVHSTSVVGPSGRDLWWALGGFIAGTIAAAVVVAALQVVAAVRHRPPMGLSLVASVLIASGAVLVAGLGFADIHARQHRREQRIADEESERLRQINEERRASEEARAADTRRGWDDLTQRMAQLDAGFVASTLAAAEQHSAPALLTWMRDNFGPFLDRNPWNTLSDEDRAAFSAYARRLLKRAARPDDPDVLHVFGMIIGAEHGLADTPGAMEECSRLGAPRAAESVASLALYLCRDGPACLEGYEGLDFGRLSRDIGRAAYWSCTHTQNQQSELCAYVRHDKS